MVDTQTTLGAIGAVAGLAGGVITAWMSWRKDERDDDAAPITQRDALITQSSASITRLDKRNEYYSARADKADERVDRVEATAEALRLKLEVQVAALDEERRMRQSLASTVERLRDALERWTEFGQDLCDNWADYRLRQYPPLMPRTRMEWPDSMGGT